MDPFALAPPNSSLVLPLGVLRSLPSKFLPLSLTELTLNDWFFVGIPRPDLGPESSLFFLSLLVVSGPKEICFQHARDTFSLVGETRSTTRYRPEEPGLLFFSSVGHTDSRSITLAFDVLLSSLPRLKPRSSSPPPSLPRVSPREVLVAETPPDPLQGGSLSSTSHPPLV